MLSYKFNLTSPSRSISIPVQVPSEQLQQVQQMQPPAAMLELLYRSGAHTSEHSGRKLLDHLTGTHKLLKNWGAPKEVCFAGLFHSIYSTSLYKQQSIDFSERAAVQAVIGTQAEHLAWLFCSIERPQAFFHAIKHGVMKNRMDRSDHPCPQPILRQLLDIECANQIEQGGRISALRQIYIEALMQPKLISPASLAAVKQYLKV